MNTPVRIQLKRTKGWKKPENTVNVARPSKWGNEHKVGRDGTAAECVAKYLADLKGRIWSEPNKRTVKAELRGKNLACWCKLGTPCHADELLKIANA